MAPIAGRRRDGHQLKCMARIVRVSVSDRTLHCGPSARGGVTVGGGRRRPPRHGWRCEGKSVRVGRWRRCVRPGPRCEPGRRERGAGWRRASPASSLVASVTNAWSAPVGVKWHRRRLPGTGRRTRPWPPGRLRRTGRVPVHLVDDRDGLRQGEALGLKWSDIDLDEGRLVVRRTRQRPRWRHGCGGAGGRKVGGNCPERVSVRADTAETKSRAGRRTIGLPDELVALLRKHRSVTAGCMTPVTRRRRCS